MYTTHLQSMSECMLLYIIYYSKSISLEYFFGVHKNYVNKRSTLLEYTHVRPRVVSKIVSTFRISRILIVCVNLSKESKFMVC